MRITKDFIVTANGLVLKKAYNQEKHPLPNPEEVEICQQWIAKFCKTIKHFNPNTSSYSLKHKVEKWSEKYVSNGSFILAALNLGYDVQSFRDHMPNAIFNMQVSLPEDAWKRVRASGFSKWLFKQKELDEPIGDLARDAIRDKTWPRKVKRFIDLRLYLESQGASGDCLRTLKESWIACYKKEPPYPDLKIQTQCERFYDGECDTLQYGDAYPKAPKGKTYIYVLFESTGDSQHHVRYIGQTINPAQRLKQHITCPGSIKKVIWTGKLLEQGTYPYMGIIELVNKEDSALAEETYIIAFGDHERRLDQSIAEVLLNVNLI